MAETVPADIDAAIDAFGWASEIHGHETIIGAADKLMQSGSEVIETRNALVDAILAHLRKARPDHIEARADIDSD